MSVGCESGVGQQHGASVEQHEDKRRVARRWLARSASGTTLTRKPTFARYLAENVFKHPVRVHMFSLLHGLEDTTVFRCARAREPSAATLHSMCAREAQSRRRTAKHAAARRI